MAEQQWPQYPWKDIVLGGVLEVHFIDTLYPSHKLLTCVLSVSLSLWLKKFLRLFIGFSVTLGIGDPAMEPQQPWQDTSIFQTSPVSNYQVMHIGMNWWPFSFKGFLIVPFKCLQFFPVVAFTCHLVLHVRLFVNLSTFFFNTRLIFFFLGFEVTASLKKQTKQNRYDCQPDSLLGTLLPYVKQDILTPKQTNAALGSI